MAKDIVYLNGAWTARSQATVGIEDRGLMFGDGVYEMVRYYNAVGLAMAQHLERLEQSLAAVQIRLPPELAGLDQISDELMRRNELADASVYWQVTRGVAPRRHAFPPAGTPPTVLAMAYPAPAFDPAAPLPTVKAISRTDRRWQLCSVKSLNLLANVLDAQAAADAGANEAILVRDGLVTEGTSRSILIVEGSCLRTHPLTDLILDSITRRIVLDLASSQGLQVVQEPFDMKRLMAADEVIAAGTTTEVATVLSVDGNPIGGGGPGPVAERLFRAFRNYVARSCRIDSGSP
ncbi:MAG: aminotransferase class IV [Phycisphaerae bacterium]|nr:aminotransferase class IV [Phycisphaerae bacterium]